MLVNKRVLIIYPTDLFSVESSSGISTISSYKVKALLFLFFTVLFKVISDMFSCILMLNVVYNSHNNV